MGRLNRGNVLVYYRCFLKMFNFCTFLFIDIESYSVFHIKINATMDRIVLYCNKFFSDRILGKCLQSVFVRASLLVAHRYFEKLNFEISDHKLILISFEQVTVQRTTLYFTLISIIRVIKNSHFTKQKENLLPDTTYRCTMLTINVQNFLNVL